MRIPGPELFFLVVLTVFGHQISKAQITSPTPWQESFSPHRSYDLDQVQIQQTLSSAPSRWDRVSGAPVLLSLPLPDGEAATFEIWRSEQMEPELANQFPDIQTFFGQQQDDHRSNIYLLLTGQQLKILYFDQRGMYSRLEPINPTLSTYHFTFRSDWGTAPDLSKACHAELDEEVQRFQDTDTGQARRGETKIYRYRLALATTGEYGSYHGTTTTEVLVAMNELLLQANAIFERESSVHFDLVAGNELLIFLDPASDPYDNTDVEQMLETNKMVCNYAIGYSNFDIGHVLSTKFGGQAQIGSICNFSRKAKAFTGMEQPEGYYMGAIFAHELAHQIGARHTQSNDCNRDWPTAFEPGSGSTLMAYAGLCEPNVQELPDDYFHGNSLELIADKTALGLIFGCVPGERTNNLPPQVDAGPDLYIPVATSFHLKGVGADPNGDSLLYQWEQMDLMTEEDTLNLNGPIFRSVPPSVLPERIIGENGNAWEQLPTHSRTARFRLTVKDLHLGFGSSAFDEMTVHFVDSVGPFTLLSPNSAPVKWETGSVQTITWDEAGTSQEPILCQTVDIYLSSDGGQNYDLRLATEIPNNGSAEVNIPLVTGNQFRLKVSCSNGAFFDSAEQLLEIFDPNAPVPVDTMITDTTDVMPIDTSSMEIDTTITHPPADTIEQPGPDSLLQDSTTMPIDTVVQDTIEMPADTLVQDTVEMPMDTLEQPVMDTIETPMPDTLEQPVVDTTVVPPIDTTITVPTDTIPNPPMDTLIDPPVDTITPPPFDSIGDMPVDTIPQPPQDTLVTGDPIDNPTDTTGTPGEDPPLPPQAGDECPACPPTVSLAPNPTSGIIYLHVLWDQKLDGRLEIVNAQGRVLQQRRLDLPSGQNTLDLDLSRYPDGMYWIRLIGRDQVLVRPVVVR